MKFTQSITLDISVENEGLIPVIAESMGYVQNEEQTAKEYICDIQNKEAYQQLAGKVAVSVYSYFGVKDKAIADSVVGNLPEAITITSEFKDE